MHNPGLRPPIAPILGIVIPIIHKLDNSFESLLVVDGLGEGYFSRDAFGEAAVDEGAEIGGGGFEDGFVDVEGGEGRSLRVGDFNAKGWVVEDAGRVRRNKVWSERRGLAMRDALGEGFREFGWEPCWKKN